MGLTTAFTDEEMALIAAQPLTTEVLAEAMWAGTAGLVWFGYEIIEPQFRSLLNMTDQEQALGMSFYRLIQLLRTAQDLRQPYQFQSLAASTRAALELAVDVSLLVEGQNDAVEKFHAHTRVERFRKAGKLVRFYNEHPELEEAHAATEQRRLVQTPGLKNELENLCQKYWHLPIGKAPDHWTGLNLADRVALLDAATENEYRRWWPLLSWYVHAGGAGVGGISADGFRAVAVVCRDLLKTVVPKAYHRVGVVLHLHRALPQFFDQLDFATRYVEVIAVSEAKLRAIGRAGRYSDLAAALRSVEGKPA